MMRGSRVAATVLPTDAGVRLISHERSWSKPRGSAKPPNTVDVEFAPEQMRRYLV
jgi:hypothetical protein